MTRFRLQQLFKPAKYSSLFLQRSDSSALFTDVHSDTTGVVRRYLRTPTAQQFKANLSRPLKNYHRKVLNLQARAACRVVHRHVKNYSRVGRALGLKHNPIRRAVQNAYEPPDDISKDYAVLHPDFLIEYPPGPDAPAPNTTPSTSLKVRISHSPYPITFSPLVSASALPTPAHHASLKKMKRGTLRFVTYATLDVLQAQFNNSDGRVNRLLRLLVHSAHAQATLLLPYLLLAARLPVLSFPSLLLHRVNWPPPGLRSSLILVLNHQRTAPKRPIP